MLKMHSNESKSMKYSTIKLMQLTGGGNLLYLDGHVGFVKYPDEFPICAVWSVLLRDYASM